jgi:transposase
MEKEEAKALIKKAAQAIEDGKSIREVAHLIQCSKEEIFCLIKFGILPKSSLPNRMLPNPYEDEVKRMVILKYTNREIAEAIGITKKSVEAIIEKFPELKGIRPKGRKA